MANRISLVVSLDTHPQLATCHSRSERRREFIRATNEARQLLEYWLREFDSGCEILPPVDAEPATPTFLVSLRPEAATVLTSIESRPEFILDVGTPTEVDLPDAGATD